MPSLGLIHERKGSGAADVKRREGRGGGTIKTYTHGMIVGLREEERLFGRISVKSGDEIQEKNLSRADHNHFVPPPSNRKQNPN